jgi:hypothetical protein
MNSAGDFAHFGNSAVANREAVEKNSGMSSLKSGNAPETLFHVSATDPKERSRKEETYTEFE